MYRICGYLYSIIFRKRMLVFEPGHSLYYVLVHEYRYMYCSSTAVYRAYKYIYLTYPDTKFSTAPPDLGAL